MKDEQHRFPMRPEQLPARLTAESAARVLNCQWRDILRADFDKKLAELVLHPTKLTSR